MQTSSPIKKAKQNALDNFHFSQVRDWLYEGKISSGYNILVCSYYEELQSTSAMLFKLLTQPLNNIKNVYYFSYISNHRFAFWDDLSCPIYSSVIINSHTSESFISLSLSCSLWRFSFVSSRIWCLASFLDKWRSMAFCLYSLFSRSESCLQSSAMLWIDLRNVILSVRPGLWLFCTL